MKTVGLGRMRAAGAALSAIVALAGCGGTSLLPGRGHRKPSGSTTGANADAGKRPAAQAAAVSVIKGWSVALRDGHIDSAARFFNLPSVFANGATEIIEIRTLQDAEAANASLPCGATYISAFQQGKLVDALFRLGNRKGAGAGACGSGSGETARVDFLVKDGKITHWLRAPSLPGDPGVPTVPGTGTGTTPGTGTGPGTQTSPGTGTTPGTGTGPNTPTEPDGNGAQV